VEKARLFVNLNPAIEILIVKEIPDENSNKPYSAFHPLLASDKRWAGGNRGGPAWRH
jgi:hypothetical protein